MTHKYRVLSVGLIFIRFENLLIKYLEMEFFGGLFGLVLIVLTPIIFLFLIRSFGSWMLRIDDVIDYQKEILNELKKLNSKKE